jgi:ketosteroid isomerase-like protein
MNLKEQLTQLEALVTKGAILDAVDQFFHDDIVTTDPNAKEMHGKAAKRKFLEGFLNGIAKVNGITLLANAVGDNVTMSEYIFDFDMKDGSKILWNEVIRRQWKDGKIVNEKYYQN